MLAAPTVRAGGTAPTLNTSILGTSGPDLILLHGLFGSGKNWTGVAKALSDEFRVVLVDLPNHGSSGWTEQFGYPAMAAAVLDVLDGLPGAGPRAILGHSMGGKVAMTLALQAPERVARLVVVDVAPVRYPRLAGFAEYLAGMRSLDLTRLSTRAQADEALREAVPDAGVRAFLLQSLRRDAGTPTGWRWQLNLPLLDRELEAIRDWPALASDPYPGPVLWLAGADSDYVTREYDQAMRALFPRVRLLRIKNSGHWVHAEQPDVFVAAVRRFLHPLRPSRPNQWPTPAGPTT